MGDVLAASPHIAIWDSIFKKRMDNLALDAILVYLIDNVDVSVLPYLAQQFDVTGYGGYRLAVTDDQKRTLIKQAIELHRYKGTVWAVKQAMSNVGFPDAVLEEHVDDHWAKFRVYVDIKSREINAAEIDALREMILFWKNTRSWLVDIAYKITLDDNITIDADFGLSQSLDDSDVMHVGGNFIYNGQATYNGSHNYNSDTDLLDVEIV